MTPQEQRIAIAKACGWKSSKDLPFTRHGSTIVRNVPQEAWYHDSVAGCTFAPPDYLNDLSAMHEAEKVLTEQQVIEYAERWIEWNSTAQERAEAFLRTLKLWK